jgi:hypothetical protein
MLQSTFGAVVALALFFGASAFLLRRPLRFLTRAPIETMAKISRVERQCDDRGEAGYHVYYRCMAEYAVEGGTFELAIAREAPPPIGAELPIVYPRGRPGDAIEGSRKNVKTFLVLFAVALSIGLLIIASARSR